MHGGPDRKRVGLKYRVVMWAAALAMVCAGATAAGAQSAKKAPAKKPAAKKKTPAAKAGRPAGRRTPAKPEATEDATKAASPESGAPPQRTAKDLFADFLHFVKIGKFRIANDFASALLKHPDAKRVRLLELSEQIPDSIEVLTIILSNSAVGANARLVLERINEGRQIRRRDPERIKADIAALAGEPQQVLNATQRLQWSGEYAVSWLIAALRDSAQNALHPRIIKALPKLGLRAVGPLVMALRVDDDVVKLRVIEALGAIGYPQALPYLKQVIEDEQAGQNIRKAAAAAMARIHPENPATGSPAAELFYDLANQYYANEGSIRADPREDEANIWYWRNGWIEGDRVPREIFDEIMTMRCCEEALRLQPDHARAEALWLAANFRREAQLGVADVSSEEPDEATKKDITRPAGYPRAIYFARSAGPRFNHMLLARALADHDAGVALGAITALAETAGESSLIGKEDVKQPLVEAMTFRDAVVRVRAALALGRALPETPFAGSQEVIPVLAQALGLTGQRNVMVVDPDPKNLNRVMGILRDADSRVVGEGAFPKAMMRAQEELPTLDACFLATDISEPALKPALAELRGQPGGKNLPVILLVKERQMALAERITREDQATGRVLASHRKARLLQEWDAANRRVGRVALNPSVALGLAIASAETLRSIAASHSRVYDVGRAESALATALKHDETDLRVLAAEALAMIPSDSAQRAIAQQALDEDNDEALRVAMFASLAESGRHNGNKLDDARLKALIQIVMKEKQLPIRTAASQAFGALNVPGNRASEIIRAQYKG